jgi:chromosome transmission fidelity protein 1
MEEQFPFPFPPYPIQQQLMNKIYNCISNSNMGLFESPTGTGKSLSVICSTMYWLKQKEAEVLKAEEVERNKAKLVAAAVEDDWLLAFDTSFKQKATSKANEVKFKALDDYDALKKRLASLHTDGRVIRPKHSVVGSFGVSSGQGAKSAGTVKSGREDSQNDSDFEDFALEDRGGPSADDCASDSDMDSDSGAKRGDSKTGSNIDALELPQIIYCSRTHSQIAQFMNEIKKTDFRDLRCVVIGSRKNLCINPQVNRSNGTSSDSFVNEKCLEMQNSKSKAVKKADSAVAEAAVAGTAKRKSDQQATVAAGPCKFLNQARMKFCGDASLGTIMDIEETITLAKEHQSCPYYSTRTALQTGAPQVCNNSCSCSIMC